MDTPDYGGFGGEYARGFGRRGGGRGGRGIYRGRDVTYRGGNQGHCERADSGAPEDSANLDQGSWSGSRKDGRWGGTSSSGDTFYASRPRNGYGASESGCWSSSSSYGDSASTSSFESRSSSEGLFGRSDRPNSYIGFLWQKRTFELREEEVVQEDVPDPDDAESPPEDASITSPLDDDTAVLEATTEPGEELSKALEPTPEVDNAWDLSTPADESWGAPTDSGGEAAWGPANSSEHGVSWPERGAPEARGEHDRRVPRGESREWGGGGGGPWQGRPNRSEYESPNVWRARGRGRGRGRGGFRDKTRNNHPRYKPIEYDPPPPRDIMRDLLLPALAQLTMLSLVDVAVEGVVVLQDFRCIGSYSWTSDPDPLYKGSPPQWRNRPMPFMVPFDNEIRMFHEDAFHMGAESTLLPLFRAVDALTSDGAATELSTEAVDWTTIDFITDRNNLRKLLRWVREQRRPPAPNPSSWDVSHSDGSSSACGTALTSSDSSESAQMTSHDAAAAEWEARKDFRIDIQLGGAKTVLMHRWAARDREYVMPPLAGYRMNFERESTVKVPGCENAEGQKYVDMLRTLVA